MGLVKFGNLVKEVKINIDRNNNPYEYYVAGDHMDSEDLTIRRKGSFATDDVGPAFTRLFKPGQILYGSRRTYLKKVAVADFEGICSNTTFVLETKDESKLRQRLLPFIMLTDDFTKWSISKSKGSTNPYILFSDLANYEFELPDINRQDELVKLLWQAYETKESYKEMIRATDEMVKSQFIEMFGLPSANHKAFKIGCIADIVSDIHYGTSRQSVENGDYPYLRMNNITYTGELDLSDLKRISIPEEELSGCIVKKGDVLFNRTNSKDLVGKTCSFPLEQPMVIAGYIIRLRMNGLVHPEYLSVFLNLSGSKKMLRDLSKGAVGQANINAKEVQSIRILIPPIELQNQFVVVKNQADKSKYLS